MKKIKKFLAAIAASSIISAVGCGEKMQGTQNSIIYYDENNSYSQAAEGVENSKGEVVAEQDLLENIPTTPAKLSEQAEVGGLNLTFTNVYNVGIIEPDNAFNYTREVLVLVCEVTNNTDKEIMINAFDFNIRYINGEPTIITTGMREMIAGETSLTDLDSFNMTLKPGESVKGFVAFAVNSQWENFVVYYKPYDLENNDYISFEVTRDMVESAPTNG